MSRVFFIRDGRGERRLGEIDLPLRLGGERCDLVLPGLPPESLVAYIALSDGHAYIQPSGEAPLFHNHERLPDSAWLKSGDRVQVGDALLQWEVRGDQVFVTVARGQAAPSPVAFTPPAAPPAAAGTPVAGAPPQPRRSRRLGYLLAAPFLALLLAAAFLLAAVPMTLSVEPAPDSLELVGFPPAIPLGARFLTLPGEYRVEARRVGYADLTETLSVGRRGPRSFELRLAELPGRLTLRVEPEQVPWRLFVDGAEAAVDPGGVADVAGGRRLLRLEAERYLPEERELEVAGLGRSQDLEIRMRPAWAEVAIDSEPPGAQVELGGVALGASPMRAEILQGRHTLNLTLEGFKRETRELEVRAGEDLHLQLGLAPLDGRLVLHSEPPGASVSLAGRYVGTTPLDLALAPGEEHRLQLAKAGYRAAERTLSMEPDEERSLSVALEPEYGIVFLTSRPADASLQVDGRPAGKATQRLRLTVRPHTLEVSKSGYAPQRVEVTPKVGVSQSLDVELKTLAQAKFEATPATLTTGAGQLLRLVRPDGAFEMGASRREPGRRSNENQRRVQLTRPYYLGEKEVSNAEFRLFSAQHSSGSAEGVTLDRDDQPVVRVGWEAAARYCNWLSTRDGLPAFYREEGGKLVPVTPANMGYRLPTEAEWAYAARAKDRERPARYPWAGSFPPSGKVGNFADARIADALAEVVPGYDDGHRVTAAVGSFAPDAGGWYDLGGNVAEWVSDYYAVYPGQVGELERDPAGPATGDHHVVRGASWRHGNITELRLSYRDYSREPRDDLGFRIARYAD